jgi:hypothetical protein
LSNVKGLEAFLSFGGRQAALMVFQGVVHRASLVGLGVIPKPYPRHSQADAKE